MQVNGEDFEVVRLIANRKDDWNDEAMIIDFKER
jgi:hypothetical protein